MEFGCAGVAFYGKTQTPLTTPALMISTTYILKTNGSFDNLPSKFLKRLEDS